MANPMPGRAAAGVGALLRAHSEHSLRHAHGPGACNALIPKKRARHLNPASTGRETTRPTLGGLVHILDPLLKPPMGCAVISC